MTSGPDRPRETFSRDDRLRKRREFEECYASGVRVSGRHLTLFLLPPENPALEAVAGAPPSRPRLGISVPRRVGTAVSRNRLRRRVREIFRRSRDLFARGGVDLVVNARPSAGAASFQELREDYRALVSKGLSQSGQTRRRP
ncbi:MAG: ribonuclease P protein component [Thermoanaerobaculia bacterium]